MEKVHEMHAKIFKAFCDEKRLAIVELLRGGEKCACVLTDLTNIKQSALSYHMKILADAKIVDCIQDGKWVNYRLNPQGCESAINILKGITTPNEVQIENKTFLCNLKKA